VRLITRAAAIILSFGVCSALLSAQRTVYVVNSSGTISTFAIGPDGELTPTGGTAILGGPRGIAITPDGRSAYVLDSAAATILAFAVDDNGTLTQIGSPVETDPEATGPFPQCLPELETSRNPCPFGLAIAPDGRRVYVANVLSNTITIFAITHDRTLRRMGSPVPAGGSPRGLALSADGDRLYVALRFTDAIAVFAVSRNGALDMLGPPSRLAGCQPSRGDPPQPECSPMFVAIAPSGRWLYTSNQASGDISAFAIGADGMLRPITGRVAAGGRPEGLAISPDGRFLYASSIDANAVSGFAIGADGRLSSLGAVATCNEAQTPAACGAIATVVTPDGKALYAVNTFSHEVASFVVGDDGTLKALPGSPMSSGGSDPSFQGVLTGVNQGPTASLAAASGVVQQPVAFDASRSADQDGTVVRYDWDFGDGETGLDAGANPVHAYARPGRFRVTVTVTDNDGCSDTLIFTGQTAHCRGSSRATASRHVRIRDAH
jgi:DNA-binding beta-propeller fold protein YncE